MGFWKDFAFTNAIFAKDEGDFLANSLIYIHEAEREEQEKEEKKKREQEEKKKRKAQSDSNSGDWIGVISYIIAFGLFIIYYSIIGIINWIALFFDAITKVGRKDKKINIKKYRFGCMILSVVFITLVIFNYIMITNNKEKKSENIEVSNSDVNIEQNIADKEEIVVPEKTIEKINPDGLKYISLQSIKDELNTGKMNVKEKYVGNSYKFNVTIDTIFDNYFRTPIDKGDYAGSEIYLHPDEVNKLSKYKVGDKITCCGKIEKISLYHKIIIKNASILD